MTHVGNYFIIDETNHAALGHCATAADPWATWERGPEVDGKGNYYWGHYFGTQEDAVQDFIKRVAQSLECKVEFPPLLLRNVPQDDDFDLADGLIDQELPTISTDGDTSKTFAELFTPKGQEKYRELLDLPVSKRTSKDGYNTYVVEIETEKQSELLNHMCYAQAGYISETQYDELIAQEEED